MKLTLKDFTEYLTPYGVMSIIKFANNYGVYLIPAVNDHEGFYYLTVIKYVTNPTNIVVYHIVTDNYVAEQTINIPLRLEDAIEAAELVRGFKSNIKKYSITKQLSRKELCLN